MSSQGNGKPVENIDTTFDVVTAVATEDNKQEDTKPAAAEATANVIEVTSDESNPEPAAEVPKEDAKADKGRNSKKVRGRPAKKSAASTAAKKEGKATKSVPSPKADEANPESEAKEKKVAVKHHHPKYEDMLTEAIRALKDRTGSSIVAISKYVHEHYPDLPANYKKLVAIQLKRLTDSGKLVKVKASFKLSDEAKKSIEKVKKSPGSVSEVKLIVSAKKPASPAKKTIEKKTVAKPKPTAKPVPKPVAVTATSKSPIKAKASPKDSKAKKAAPLSPVPEKAPASSANAFSKSPAKKSKAKKSSAKKPSGKPATSKTEASASGTADRAASREAKKAAAAAIVKKDVKKAEVKSPVKAAAKSPAKKSTPKKKASKPIGKEPASKRTRKS